MAEITNTNVGDLVEALRDLFLPVYDTGQRGRVREACGHATPQQLSLLYRELRKYTDEVKSAADRHGLLREWSDLWTGEKRTEVDPNVSQFGLDMAHWEIRLARYAEALDSVTPEDAWTLQGCRRIYPLVTGPLLDGIWYEVLPGLSLNAEEKQRMASHRGHPDENDVTTFVAGELHPGGHSNAKPPDLITPFSLGNQVLVWKEHQDERARQFWADLEAGLRKLLPPPLSRRWALSDWLRLAGYTVLATTLFAGVYYRGSLIGGPGKPSR